MTPEELLKQDILYCSLSFMLHDLIPDDSLEYDFEDMPEIPLQGVADNCCRALSCP